MKCTPSNIMKINTTIKLRPRFIKAEIVPDMTIIYFRKFILRIKSPRPTIACIPCVVDSVKNVHNTRPSRSETAK